MSVTEWDALPWYEQRAYMDGFEWELGPADPDEPQESVIDLTGSWDGLTQFGVNVQQV